MPRNLTTGVFTRVSNSFSNPVYGTVIDPTDADALFDDYDGGLTFNDSEPLILVGSTSGALTILAPDTASGTITLPTGTTDFSATGGAGQVVKQASAGGAFTVGTVPASEIASPGALTKVDDTNVTLTLGGTPSTALLRATSITAGWTGTLAAGRLNANVVQAVTNDTNVTGSISAQNLTLGWTGTLAAARLNANVVQAVVNDTNVTGSISTQTLTLGWTGTLANSRLANMAAYTLKGNFTGSAAAPQDSTIGSLTQKASPASTDLLLIQDQAASGQLKYATVSSVASAGSVSSIAGNTGAFTLTQPITNNVNAIVLNATIYPQGRITLTSGAPVMTTTVAGASTVYYTPYVGNLVPIYDGTNFIPTAFTQVSQATSDATKSPAAVGANAIYDLFCWDDAGTFRCTRGPAWSSSSSRGTGAGTTELERVNGILLNKYAITNGPGADRGTYVGTIASTAGSLIPFNLGGSASGGSAGTLYVWNMYNRVLAAARSNDTSGSYAYSSATIRQAQASSGNQINFVLGQQADSVQFSYAAECTTASSLSAAVAYGVGFDTTSAYSVNRAVLQNSAANAVTAGGTNSGSWIQPAIGTHFISANESTPSATASTMNSASTNSLTVWLNL